MSISLKELKKNRLTPAEKWVLEAIDGIEPKIYSNGDVNWYDKNDERLFTQHFKNGYLYVSFDNIWLVLEEDFGLNDNEIEDLLTNLLYDYTDNGKLKIT